MEKRHRALWGESHEKVAKMRIFYVRCWRQSIQNIVKNVGFGSWKLSLG